MVYPQVLQVPWVSHDTVNLMVRFLPICLQSVSPGQSPINTNCIIDLLHDVELPNEVEV